jgi:hypothetical protein
VGEAEAEVLIEIGIFFFVEVTIPDEVVVSEGGLDGPDSANAPLSGGHAMDEFKLEEIGGLKRIDISLLEFLEESVILIAEDDGSGAEPVFEGV